MLWKECENKMGVRIECLKFPSETRNMCDLKIMEYKLLMNSKRIQMKS